MPYKLSQLKTNLRLRLGEPEDGTLSSSVTYQDQSGVDELKEVINQGIKQVTIDCLEMGSGLLISQQNFSVSADVTEYALPLDFISVIDLYHLHQGTTYRLLQHPLRGLKDGHTTTSTSEIYEYYDVYGNTAQILGEGNAGNYAGAEGAVDGGTTTTLTDAQTDFTGLGITVNKDIVRNITDGSYAKITNFTSTQLTTEPLAGGANNSFEGGHKYQIESAEENQQVLHTYPPIGSAERKSAFSNTTDSNNDSFVVPTAEGAYHAHSVDATFTSVPSNGRVQLSIRFSASPSFSASSPYTYIQSSVFDVVSAGTPYTFLLPLDRQLYQKVSSAGAGDALAEGSTTAYYRIDFTDSLGNPVTTSKWELFTYQGEEGLQLHYARYPADLTAADDEMELPDWSATAVVLYAEYIARMKLNGGRSNESAQAYQEYQIEVERIKRMMHVRNSDRSNSVTNIWGPRVAPRHKNVPVNIRLPLS